MIDAPRFLIRAIALAFCLITVLFGVAPQSVAQKNDPNADLLIPEDIEEGKLPQIAAQYQSLPLREDVYLSHTDLVNWYGGSSPTDKLVVIPDPALAHCSPHHFDKGFLYFRLVLGLDEYKYGETDYTAGKNFALKVHIKAYDVNDVEVGKGFDCELKLGKLKPEAVCRFDVSNIINQVAYFKPVGITYYQYPNVAADVDGMGLGSDATTVSNMQNDIRLHLYYTVNETLPPYRSSAAPNEHIENPADPVVLLADPVSADMNKNWLGTLESPLSLKWNLPQDCGTDEFPSYQIQLLRLFNRESDRYDMNVDETSISETIDWTKALTFETGPLFDENGDQVRELTLTVAEGRGYYVWRVRPIGNKYPGGIANDRNWGEWSLAPEDGQVVDIKGLGKDDLWIDGTQITGVSPDVDIRDAFFFYLQFDETATPPVPERNWAFSRVFTEGEEGTRIHESLSYMTPMMRNRQAQVHMRSENKMLVSETMYDLAGRPVLGTLIAPMDWNGFSYQQGFASYGVSDFDDDLTWNNPSTMSGTVDEYYSDNTADLTVPGADSYPYARSRFMPDGRITEIGGAGDVYRIGGGAENKSRSARVFYGKAYESELLALFGDEAPDASTVSMVYRVDPNKVTSVQYVSKSGRALATAMVKASASSVPLEVELPDEAEYDEISKTVVDAFSVQGSDRVYSTTVATLSPDEVINLSYNVTPSLVGGCVSVCETCKYKVSLKIYSAEDPDLVHHQDEKDLFDFVDLCAEPPSGPSQILLKTINDPLVDDNPDHLDIIPPFPDPGTWIVEFRLVTDNVDPADPDNNTFARVAVNTVETKIADDLRTKLLDKIADDLEDANLFDTDPQNLGLYAWLENEATSSSDPDIIVTPIGEDNFPLDPMDPLSEAVAFDVLGTGEYSCWSVIIPKLSCVADISDFDLDDDGTIEVSSASDDELDFELMLVDRWGGTDNYNYTDEDGNLTGRTFPVNAYEYFYIDGQPLADLDGSGTGEVGAFNKLVQNMLNDPDADYTVPELLGAWSAIVENYPALATVGASGDPDDIATDVNLIEEFLMSVGKMYHGVSDCPYGNCTNGTGAPKGYIDHAYKYFFFEPIVANNPADDPETQKCVEYVGYTTAWNTDPDERDFEFVDTDQDPSNDKKWELLYNCIYSKNRKPENVQDLFDNCECEDPESNECMREIRDQVEEQCRSVCEMRADGFRQEVIRMYHAQDIYVEGEPNIPTGAQTVSELQVECLVRAMVVECEGNCELTEETGGDPNDPSRITGAGSAAEIANLEKVLSWRMKLSDGSSGCTAPASMLSVGYETASEGIQYLMNKKLREYRLETGDQYRGEYNSNQLRDYFIQITGASTTGCWDEYVVYDGELSSPFPAVATSLEEDCCSDNHIPGQQLLPDRVGIFDFGPNIRTEFVIEENDGWIIAPDFSLKLRTWCERNGKEYMQEAVLCDALTFASCTTAVCYEWQELDIPEGGINLASCEEMLARRLRADIAVQVQETIQRQTAEFANEYRVQCLDPATIDDELEISQQRHLYHFTLYYYDRAGNLVRTVPPAGVNLVPADPQGNRDRNTHPAHDLVTTYEYNSFGQTVISSSPDEGESRAFFDDAGRLRLSQDAKQKAETTLSYTSFDDLGRIVETGQSDLPSYGDEDNDGDTDESDLVIALQGAADDPLFPETQHNPEQRTFIRYTTPDASDAPQYSGEYIDGKPQKYTLNRIAHVYTDDDVHTQYSYDPHGNVDWIQQDIPDLGVNWARYEYDVISGNMLKLHYNEGWQDGFKHAWKYDKDDRLIEVLTSRDGIIWDSDARYTYALHGPMKRIEYGEDKVQGRDFVFTLQGWLKGINHPALNASSSSQNYDPGQDGEIGGPNSEYAYDAFGMMLGYFTGDFNRSGSGFNSTNQMGPGMGQINRWHMQPTANLYNGNIASWTSNSQATGAVPFQHDGVLTGHQYEYDVLGRILSGNFKIHSGAGFTETGTANQYDVNYSYDPNGNIQTLKRWGPSGQMDNMTYQYYLGEDRNRLRRVFDGVAAGTYPMDIDNQPDQPGYTETTTRYEQNDYYQYDEIGNLISDKAEGTTIEWSVHGKVLSVTKTSGEEIRFTYDAHGNRVVKSVINPQAQEKKTFYVYESGGKVLAVYNRDCSIGPDPNDMDQDGVPDNLDNCPTIFNHMQGDFDNDGLGDVCDNDIDNDTHLNGSDPDDDNDGTSDATDPCPYDIMYPSSGLTPPDSDGDGIFDCVDDDQDNDGIPDNHDNCPWVPNPGQEDANNNEIGDICECSNSVEWMVYGNGAEGRIAVVRPDGIGRANVRGTELDIIPDNPVTGNPTVGKPVVRVLDEKSYELNDHLGNVRVLISDVKIPADQTTGGGSVVAQPGQAPFETKLHAVNNYYPFGMLQPERHWSTEKHRYGFNGKEMDNEWNDGGGAVVGTGNVYDFDARMLDVRLGRWFSVDPDAIYYTSSSPYNSHGDNPVLIVDDDGRRLKIYPVRKLFDGSEDKFILVSNPEAATDIVLVWQKTISILFGDKIRFAGSRAAVAVENEHGIVGYSLDLGMEHLQVRGSDGKWLQVTAENIADVKRRMSFQESSALDQLILSLTDETLTEFGIIPDYRGISGWACAHCYFNVPQIVDGRSEVAIRTGVLDLQEFLAVDPGSADFSVGGLTAFVHELVEQRLLDAYDPTDGHTKYLEYHHIALEHEGKVGGYQHWGHKMDGKSVKQNGMSIFTGRIYSLIEQDGVFFIYSFDYDDGALVGSSIEDFRSEPSGTLPSPTGDDWIRWRGLGQENPPTWEE